MKSFSAFIQEKVEGSNVVAVINHHILTDPHMSDLHAKFYVFRLGSSGTLENRNAGDILGIAKFTSSDNAEVSQTGNVLAMYEITNPAPGRFGEYTLLRGGNNKAESKEIGRQQVPIKWGIARNHASWYSFPAGGNWSAKLIHQVHVKDLDSIARELDFSYFGANEPDDVLVVYAAFFGVSHVKAWLSQ